VWCTEDGEVCVFHDKDFQRMCAGPSSGSGGGGDGRGGSPLFPKGGIPDVASAKLLPDLDPTAPEQVIGGAGVSGRVVGGSMGWVGAVVVLM
jgi:hypothetical protein